MRIAYINPNSTEAMTDGIVAAARAALSEAEIFGLTNTSGPPAIEGAADGAAAVPGLIARLPVAREAGADVIVIACFDDTGLESAQAAAGCPVLGIGQSAYVMAGLLGLRFSVITSVQAAVPVIEANIAAQGYTRLCASVRASSLPVLTIEAGGPRTIAQLGTEIAAAADRDGADCAILGCAGMAPLAGALSAVSRIPLIDGVAASAQLARSVAGLRGSPRAA